MNSLQRMKLALSGKKADRMPWVPAIYKHKAFLINKTPSEVACNAELLYQAVIEEFSVYQPDILTIGTWNDFLWPLIITNSIRSRTLTVGLTMYIFKWWTQYSLAMAGALLVIGRVIIVFLIFQKKFVTGITLTGMKL